MVKLPEGLLADGDCQCVRVRTSLQRSRAQMAFIFAQAIAPFTRFVPVGSSYNNLDRGSDHARRMVNPLSEP
jgi:hypothetical protein